ncbi:MAG TPA: YHYH protein [Verrucomicrobiae bacterium]
MKKFWLLVLVLSTGFRAQADALLTSWLTTYSGQYARVYTTTNNRNNGSSATTWANQSLPVYADTAAVLSSTSWVYVRAADLPSYVTGPWLNPQGVPGQFSPTNQHLINRFPRVPTSQAGTKTISGTGYSGLYVNGVAIFNFTDGKAWDPTNAAVVSGPHNQATYYWHRNAPVGEGFNFDYPLGHQNPAGVYHTHQQPIALRYQLGDHVDYNSTTKNYAESTSTNLAHSPIMGWAYDGYPIYGPYGYSISNNAANGVRRMVSGYVQRDGKNGTDNLTNNLNTIPAWYARFRLAHFGGSYSTTAPQARATVAGTNTLGTYGEDFSYYGDLTNSATGKAYVMGTNTFDLDEYNGRWCVTPEYPGGTYAYFLTVDASGTSAYPYAIAYEYYGAVSGGSVSAISEAVTTNFLGGPDAALKLNTPVVNSNYVVTLTWSSTEGGTYQVESATNSSTWTVQKSGLGATVGVSTTTNFTSSGATGTNYVRVLRTALASYDAVGGGTGIIGQTNVQTWVVTAYVSGTNAVLGNATYSSGNFIFNLTGTSGASYVIQTTTNLASGTWTPVYTNTAPFSFTNPGSTAYTQRFFRAVTP